MPDMMIPGWNYDRYCVEEALNEKKQQIQGETTDAMDFLHEAMTERDLSLFLAQIYHDWLYKFI